ncbi:MAG: response regulator, partial [Acidobacteriota bacterium]
MRRVADRFVCSVPVEVVVGGARYRAAIDDVSRGGLFVRIAEPLAAGTELRVVMPHDGRIVTATGVVAHRLAEPDARALGREAGVGVALNAPESAMDELFALAVERLIRSCRAAAPLGLHAVVADPSRAVAERAAAALAEAGFAVATATSGREALAVCLRRTPDVVIAERALPVLDGFRLIDLLARVPAACGVPVVIVSQYAEDLEEAFARGARDFLAKPFSPRELVARVRRLAQHERPALRGALAVMPLSALLALFELERTTG